MLIISILLSGVNWIQTVTIVWSETSLFLGRWGDVCPGIRLAHTHNFPRSLVLFLFGDGFEKYINKDTNCNDHGSSRVSCGRCFPSVIANACSQPAKYTVDPHLAEAETGLDGRHSAVLGVPNSHSSSSPQNPHVWVPLSHRVSSLALITRWLENDLLAEGSCPVVHYRT